MAAQKRKAAPTKDEANPAKKRGRGPKKGTISGPSKGVVNIATGDEDSDHTASKGSAAKTKTTKAKPTGKRTNKSAVVKSAAKTKKKVQDTVSKRPASGQTPQSKNQKEDEVQNPHEPSYWLMKAEPESRIEKGKDVKFSIDDLKNASAPEPWDGKHRIGPVFKSVALTMMFAGVRNLAGLLSYKIELTLLTMAARNNMRAMLKGDLAFFYHSNCKVPGIVGIMEIVQEHSTDGKTRGSS